MLISDYKFLFCQKLEDKYSKEEVLNFFFLLIEHRLNLRRVDLALDRSLKLTSSDLEYFSQCLQELESHRPIQYIIGSTEFMDLDYKVTEAVLIPRPETEELINWIKQDFQDANKTLKILDIGTGSGCIPISLAKNFVNAEVHSIDVSSEALEIARYNAKANNVTIKFINKNILSVDKLDDTYDIIVSNPPYVRELEQLEISQNVLKHEPSLALFVDDNDPLVFYRKITQLAKDSLNEGGSLYFEINEYLGKETSDLIIVIGLKNIVLRKDIFERDRMIKANK